MDFFKVQREEKKVWEILLSVKNEDPIDKLYRVMNIRKNVLSRTMLKLKEQLEKEKKQLQEDKLKSDELRLINYKLSLLEKDFYDLTEEEIKLINMDDEYNVEIFFIFRMQALYLPVIPKGKRAYHYDFWEAKGKDKKNLTLNDFVNFFERYVYMSYDEIMDDIKKIKSGKVK